MPIFQDHFIDNRHNWSEQDDERARMQMGVDGYAYLIQHRQHKGVIKSVCRLALPYDLPYKVQGIFEKVSGPAKSGYGMVWRRGVEKETSEWAFVIRQSGEFAINFWDGEKWDRRVDWTETKHLHGEGRADALAIIQQGKRAHFHINGHTVKTLEMPEVLPEVEKQGLGFIVSGIAAVRVHSLLVLSQRPGMDSSGELEDEDMETVMADLDLLIGMDNVKEEIQTLINFLKVAKLRQDRELLVAPVTTHVVLMGPPGTGKTTIARLLARIYRQLGFLEKGHIIETDRSGLVAEYIGQTAPKVDEKVKEAMGGVLFIDEAYALKPEGDSGRDYGQEAIETLLKRMEDHRGELAVVIAGYPDEMNRFLDANPGVKSRFNRYFHFEHYEPEILVQIFEGFCEQMGYKMTKRARERLLEHMAAAHKDRTKTFGNGRYARNLIEKVVEKQANRLVKQETLTRTTLTRITVSDIPEYEKPRNRPKRAGFGQELAATS